MRLDDAVLGGGPPGTQQSIRLADSAGRHMGDLTFHLDIMRDMGHLRNEGRVNFGMLAASALPHLHRLLLSPRLAYALGGAPACKAPATLFIGWHLFLKR